MYFICLFSVPWFIYSSSQNRVNEKVAAVLRMYVCLCQYSVFIPLLSSSLLLLVGIIEIKWWTFNLCIGSLTHVLMSGMKHSRNTPNHPNSFWVINVFDRVYQHSAPSFRPTEFESIDLNISGHLTLSMATIKQTPEHSHSQPFPTSHCMFNSMLLFFSMFVWSDSQFGNTFLVWTL